MLIAANSEPLFARLATLMGRTELASEARFRDNPARVAHGAELDAIIAAWTRTRAAADLEALLASADIPSSRAYTAADIARDPQYLARGMVRTIEDPALGSVLHSGIVPHIPEGLGAIRWAGPDVGQHGHEILSAAGYDDDAIAHWRAAGVTA